MSSSIETFLCMVQHTDYMLNLIFNSEKPVEEYQEEINILFDDERFKRIKEIVELNNKHINAAIKELLNNQETNNIIKDTDITKEEIEEIKKYLN